MNKLNVTAFLFLLIATATISSCKKENFGTTYTNSNIQMSPAQVVPPNTTAATGTLSVAYNDKTKLLNYTVTWSGLSGAPLALHIHGTAGTGFNAAIIQNITGASALGTSANGTYSNFLFADGVLVKEEDILAGQFYLDIHTAAYPAAGAAQIRGQITFPQ